MWLVLQIPSAHRMEISSTVGLGVDIISRQPEAVPDWGASRGPQFRYRDFWPDLQDRATRDQSTNFSGTSLSFNLIVTYIYASHT